MKSCCFIGHRKIDADDNLKKSITDCVKNLISVGVEVFAFGSRSEFNDLCYDAVSELKSSYPNIVRVNFTCAHEAFISQADKQRVEQTFNKVFNRTANFQAFEQEIEHKNKYTAGKGAYIERNYAMIDYCDICVFYYNKNYMPPIRKHSKHDLLPYQPKSGTELAYKYAKQKHKKIINLYKISKR